MSQVRTAALFFVGLLSASFVGCSDPNTQAPFNSDTGSHAAGWLPADHMAAATSNLNSCSSCHGADYSGGVSRVSCTSCHMGGVTDIHPAGWMGDACDNHGSFVLSSPSGTSGCANTYCHGTDLKGVPDSGPSCTKCHPTIPTQPSCGTCHGIPPDGSAPAGNVYPNLPGKHATHMALANVTCVTCHNRSCDKHMDGTVQVIFDAAYNAKSGTGSFNSSAKTCQEVSCHGGPRTQTLAQMQHNPTQSDPAQTPDWYNGTITVSTQCDQCHIYGTMEFNSYNSGKHFFHLGGEGVAYATCASCHDTVKLSNPAVHFPSLNSPVISAGTASATTNSWLNYNGTTCTNATSGCHSGDTRNWWQ